MINRKEPWPHQQEVIELAETTNVFLADDTGTGKTISSIEAARLQWQDGSVLPAPILVFCVKSAKLQWLSVIKQQYPGDDVYLMNKGDKDKFQRLRRKKVWLIAHFHVMHDDDLWKYIYRQVFAAMVIDEAHRIKGHQTEWAIRIRNLKARRKIAATATPQEKSAADMYNILRFLTPHLFRSYWEFVSQYCLTTPNHFAPDSPNIQGTNPETFPQLAEIMAPFYYRRMKSDVRDDMPELIEEVVPVEMTSAQARFYQALEDSDDILVWEEWMLENPLLITNQLALLIRLWQAATFPGAVPGSKVKSSGKLLWVDDWLRDNPNERVILFTWFRDTAIYLADKYSDMPPYMGGHDNPPPTPDNRVVVGTIASMGESLDLPWVDTSIFLSRSRSTIQMKQAKDRMYRMTIESGKRAIYLESVKPGGGETIDHIIAKSLAHKWTDAEFVAATLKSIRSGEPVL